MFALRAPRLDRCRKIAMSTARRVIYQSKRGPDYGEHATQVLDLNRARIVRAMTEISASEGYEAATVAQVLRRAGCARRTFYELFPNRQACFLTALEQAVNTAGERVEQAVGPERPWPEQVRAATLVLLEFCEEEPELALLCLSAAPAAGASARAYRTTVLRELAERIDRAARAPGESGPPSLTAQALVGGIVEIVSERVSLPSQEPLVELVNQLTALIVYPFLGLARANEELKRHVPRRPAARRSPSRDLLPLPRMRLTRRTLLVLCAIASSPGLSNRAVAEGAGITDQGQVSKLLSRLQGLGLVENTGPSQPSGRANAWRVTETGEGLVRALRPRL
jgi:AcrR family transcriptional regulator/DNA-binding MarR family transcriptional regulator